MIFWAAVGATGLSFLLSLMLTTVVRRLALSWGFVAVPSSDRHHRQPTPLLGGAAMLLAMVMPSVLALALAAVWARTGPPEWMQALAVHVPGVVSKIPVTLGILAGAAALLGLGLIDDRRRLGPWIKLAGQLAVSATIVLTCNVRLLTHLGEPTSSIASILWLVVVINAMNFLDNVDGLAAGVTVICAAALLAAAAASGQLFVGAWLCLLIGSAAGFLVHNFPPARIFMGDAGSLVLGYFLGVLSILTTYYHAAPSQRLYGVFMPLVLMAVPLYDTVSVITLRIRDRRNPMVGDTRHFSHRLLRRGMSPRKAVLTIYLATGGTAVGASLLLHVDEVGAILVACQTAVIVLLIALLESAGGRSKP